MRNNLGMIVVCCLILLIDQLTKFMAIRELPLHQAILIFPGFDLFLTYNTGAAFSFLSDQSGWQRWFLVIIAIIAIMYLIFLVTKNRHKSVFCIALICVIGGALGNLIDRLIHGAVVDFISLHFKDFYWPAFNIADSFITIGVGLVIVDMFIFSKNPDEGAGRGKSSSCSLE